MSNFGEVAIRNAAATDTASILEGAVNATGASLEIARGNRSGLSAIRKYGDNPDIDTAAAETIWDGGGTYVAPTTARIHDIASTDVTDVGTVVSSGTATGGSATTLEDTGATFVTDGVAVADTLLNDSNCEVGLITGVTETVITVAGSIRDPNGGFIGTAIASGDSYRAVTGGAPAGILYVQGLDASVLEQQEFIVLNGTTNVPTIGSYSRMFRARCFGANSTGLVGTVTATAQTDLTVSCQVVNGNNQSLMAVYTVPINKNGYIVKWWGTLSRKVSATATIALRGGRLNAIGYIIQQRSINSTGTSSFDYDYAVPLPVGPGVDIWVEADTDTNNTGIASGFDIVLEDI